MGLPIGCCCLRMKESSGQVCYLYVVMMIEGKGSLQVKLRVDATAEGMLKES